MQMDNFILGVQPKLFFGDECLADLSREVLSYGSKIMLVYGQNSIKKHGIYDEVLSNLGGFQVLEFGGVKSNPESDHLNEGIEFAKRHDVDVIIAVGGGSVIDEAKGIACGIGLESGDVWDLQLGKEKISRALPVIAVVTVPATSSESNSFFVFTHTQSRFKVALHSDLCRPKAVFLNPKFTFSIPKKYTTYAAVDILSHMTEGYFTCKNEFAPVNFRYIEGLSIALIETVGKIFAQPDHYDARASFMYLATLAFNGIAMSGLYGQTFYAHKLEHPISGMYDVAHGAGLSVVIPAVLEYKKQQMIPRLASFGRAVFELSDSETQAADNTIIRLRQWFREIGAPLTFGELGIGSPDIERMAQQIHELGPMFFQMNEIIEIYHLCE